MHPCYHASLSPFSAPELEPLVFSLTLTRSLAAPGTCVRLPEGLLESMLPGQEAGGPLPCLHLRISPYEMLHLRSETLLSSIHALGAGAYVLGFENRGLIKGSYQVKLCLSSGLSSKLDDTLDEWLLLGYPSAQHPAPAGPPLAIVEQVIPGIRWPKRHRSAR